MARQFEQLDLIGRGQPIRGMRSSVDPSQLPEGFWQVVENLRITGFSVQARREPSNLKSGDAALLSSSPSYLGHFYGYLNGTRRLYVAYGTGSPAAGRIFSVNLSTWATTEITNSTTRFTSATKAVEFAAFRDPGADDAVPAREFLMVCNGDETNRIVDPEGGSVALAASIEAPTISEFTYKAMPSAFMKISTVANSWTRSDSDDVSTAIVGSSGKYEAQFFIESDADKASGDYFEFDFQGTAGHDIVKGVDTAGLTMAYANQFWIICSDNISDPIWNYVNLKFKINGVYILVYSCSGVNRHEPVYVNLNNGYYLAAFTINNATGAYPSSTRDPLDTDYYIAGIRGEVERPPNSNRTVKIAGFLAGGPVPGQTEYSLSYATSGSRVESRCIVPTLLGSGVLFEYGVTKNLTIDLPHHATLRYVYRTSWFNPSSTIDANQVWIYRREPGDSEYYHVRSDAISAYNGAAKNSFDHSQREDINTNRIAPSLTNQGPPVGLSVCSANNRLYIGGAYESGTNPDKLNQVWISDEGYPTRFTPLAADEDDDGTPDPASGTYNRLPSERVRRIVALPAYLGTAPVLIFTDRGVRRIDGYSSLDLTRPTPVNEHGTASPRSVAINQQDVYYLDSDGVVRRIRGGIESQPISLWKIDDQLRAVTDPSKVFAVWWQEKYYLAVTDGGSSFNRILIYESQLDEWVRDAYSGLSWNALFSDDSVFPRRLLGFARSGTDEKIYRIEDPANSGAPTIGLKTRQIEVDGWQRLLWGTVGAVADKDASTWTTTRVDPFDSTNTTQAVGKLNLNVSPERAWVEDRTVSGGMCGLTAPALELSISGPYSPGKFLRKLTLYFEGRSGGGYKGSA